jgi:hypothetical protein
MHVPHAVRNTLVVRVWSMDVLAQMPFEGRRMYHVCTYTVTELLAFRGCC